MLQITPQMKILVAVEPADFRRGIDGLARLCQQALHEDPFAGTVFVHAAYVPAALYVPARTEILSRPITLIVAR